MVDGKIEALDAPSMLKKTFGTASMDDVFYQLARGAKRND
jgi:ABC-2 type transport system ATP-binding protein